MNCSNCGAEWTPPKAITTPLSHCPFCGEALQPPAPKKLTTVEDVLTEITARFGTETLKNGQKTIALFADLSPELRRERLLLSYLIQSEGNIKLLAVRGKPVTEQQACFRQVCRYMAEEQFVAEEAARKICMSFSVAIGLTLSAAPPASEPVPPQKAAPPASEPVPPQKAAPQKAAPPQKPDYTKDATIKTFAQYQKALAAYYLALGQKPLTDAQIHHFLRTNHLDRVFGITISDVREDLQALCAKQKPAAAKVPTFSNNIQQVDSYDKYMYALELAYLRNGKVMLTKEQINAFLSAHDLSRKFKILPSEVEADLRTIARKYT